MNVLSHQPWSMKVDENCFTKMVPASGALEFYRTPQVAHVVNPGHSLSKIMEHPQQNPNGFRIGVLRFKGTTDPVKILSWGDVER